MEKLRSGPPATHARRVIFVDLARALAVVLMLYGHTIDALLAPAYRTGVWFDVWVFQRGLTASLFLLLSGFAFSVATSKHWTSHLNFSWRVLKRTRRFALFILLGYALHFPVNRLIELPQAGDTEWRAFLAVDVLQLIGATFIGVQLLVLLTRLRGVFAVTTFALTIAIVTGTTVVWSVDWAGFLPPWLVAYLTPATGSQFPLFPWSAFVLLGAGLGQLYARWGGAHLGLYANAALLAPGATMVGLGFVLRMFSVPASGAQPADVVPSEFLIRAGVCLVGLAGVAHGSARLTRLPHIFSSVAQETLLIYFVHLCIVYGSVWNQGLSQIYGQTLNPLATSFCVAVVIASMATVAFYWNWCKHSRPPLARWITVTSGVLLAFGLA